MRSLLDYSMIKSQEKLVTSFMDGPLESMTKRSEATEAVENAHEAPHHP